MAGAEGKRSGFCGAGLERKTCGWSGARDGMINVMDQVGFLGHYIVRITSPATAGDTRAGLTAGPRRPGVFPGNSQRRASGWSGGWRGSGFCCACRSGRSVGWRRGVCADDLKRRTSGLPGAGRRSAIGSCPGVSSRASPFRGQTSLK